MKHAYQTAKYPFLRHKPSSKRILDSLAYVSQFLFTYTLFYMKRKAASFRNVVCVCVCVCVIQLDNGKKSYNIMFQWCVAECSTVKKVYVKSKFFVNFSSLARLLLLILSCPARFRHYYYYCYYYYYYYYFIINNTVKANDRNSTGI